MRIKIYIYIYIYIYIAYRSASRRKKEKDSLPASLFNPPAESIFSWERERRPCVVSEKIWGRAALIQRCG